MASSSSTTEIKWAESLVTQLEVLTVDQQNRLARALGLLQSRSIGLDADALKNAALHKSPDSLVTLDGHNWLGQRNSVLLTFLTSCSGDSTITRSGADRHREVLLATAVQAVYRMKHAKFVGPLSFRDSLVVYNHTSSKLVLDLLAKINPGGTYELHRQFLEAQAERPLALPPLYLDIVVVFDNQQVIGRSWRLHCESKPLVSVITAVLHVEFQSQLQFNPAYHRLLWFYEMVQPQNKEESEAKLLAAVEECNHQEKSAVVGSLYELLSRWISNIDYDMQSISKREDIPTFQDSVGAIASVMETYGKGKVCSMCNQSYPKAKRSCDHCKIQLPTSPQMSALLSQKLSEAQNNLPPPIELRSPDYGQFDIKRQVHPKIHVGEPILRNPNSYENLAIILRQIGKQLNIRRYQIAAQRNFLWFVVDGSPYHLISYLQRETLYCVPCEQSFFGPKPGTGMKELLKHYKEKHENKKPDLVYEFDWVQMMPGPGHIEVNMMRAAFDLTWDAPLNLVAESLGFKSPTAQQYFKDAHDHHKAYDCTVIARESIAAEILFPYVCEVRMVTSIDPSSPKTASVDDFVNFVKHNKTKNKNLWWFYFQLAHIWNTIHVYRCGIRMNNSAAVTGALKTSLPLFFLQNHPIYQQLVIRDLHNRSLLPAPLLEFRQSVESVCVRGDLAQGLDYILEQYNKQSKRLLPQGVPTEKNWKAVYHSFDAMTQIRNSCFAWNGMLDPYSKQQRMRYYTAEVQKVRALYRSSNVLDDVAKKKEILSTSGDEIPDLFDCKEKLADESIRMYIKSYVRHEKPKLSQRYPHLPSKDHKQLEKLLKKDFDSLCTKVEKQLRTIAAPELQEYSRMQWEICRQKADAESAAHFYLRLLHGRIIIPPEDTEQEQTEYTNEETGGEAPDTSVSMEF